MIMGLFNELQKKRDLILAVAENYGISDVRVFGSVARGEEDAASDIDLLVTISKKRSYFDLMNFKEEMVKLLARKVDVISDRGVSSFIKDRIFNEARFL